MLQKLSVIHIRLVLVVIWLILLISQTEPLQLIYDYAGFSLLGVIGAIFANSTGAGGGVIFVPFFNQLNFDSQTTVATSFAIQCCGMTAGALTWWAYYRKSQTHNPDWQGLNQTLFLTVPLSILGIFSAQLIQFLSGGMGEAHRLHIGFGVFSILLSVAIFASIPLLKKERFKQYLSGLDKVSLPLISYFGGGITAYLSIGVGELIAVFLIIRGFNITFAIAVAVILSAFSVWAGVLFHVFNTGAVYWPVVLFAGAGAIIGGILAKHVVLYFSPTRLKLFFAAWVLILGISALPL